MKKSNMCLILFCLAAWLHAGIVPYISPGLMLSWNFHSTPSAIVKISIGLGYEITFRPYTINSCFTNLTIGKRIFIDYNQKQPNYLFTEIESGIWTGYLISGIGLGTAYYKNGNKLRIVPKAAIFSGDGLFLRSDFILDNRKIDADLGGMLVLPLGAYLFNTGFGPIYTGDY
jgi:hypothetical protein